MAVWFVGHSKQAMGPSVVGSAGKGQVERRQAWQAMGSKLGF